MHWNSPIRWLTTLALPALLGTAIASPANDPLSALGVRASEGAAAGYLPDRVCGTCHAALYQSFQDVGMARSFARATPQHLVEDFDNASYFHEKSGRHYRMERRGDELWFRRWKQDEEGDPTDVFETRVDWIMGSGNRARSYLYQTRAGEMFELPLGWYSQERKWAMSPGFDLPEHLGVLRPVRRECMFCHNAFPEVAAGSDAADQPHLFPDVLPEGIGCQRCHGPAADHVRAVLTGQPIETIRARIVNPIRLPWPERNQVCFQCHLLPSVEVIGARRMGRDLYSFRPGEKLSDYLLHVDIDQVGLPKSERFQINHHAYRFLQSTCYRESDGEMGCVSCHDPHVKVKGEARRTWFRDKCLACHEGFQHEEPAILASAEAKGVAVDYCTRCHMPQRRTQDVVEVSMTDHRIARGPFDEAELLAPLQREVPDITDIEFFMPGEAPKGDEARAYLALSLLRAAAGNSTLDMLTDALTPLTDKPVEWLRELLRYQLRLQREQAAMQSLSALQQRDDSSADTRMMGSTLMLMKQQPAEALALLEGMDEAGGFNPALHYNRALAYRAQGKPEFAITELRQALAQRPVMTQAWFEMARNQVALGQAAQARSSLQHALSIEPGHARSRELLRTLADDDQSTESPSE
ncbi:MAG: tetratricopeptide repeat protein [Lysobacteraceae bacterium]